MVQYIRENGSGQLHRVLTESVVGFLTVRMTDGIYRFILSRDAERVIEPSPLPGYPEKVERPA